MRASARAFFALVAMDVRRIVRTRWAMPLLIVVPLFLVPISELAAVLITRPSAADTVAIPMDLPDGFPLQEQLLAFKLTAVPSADPRAAVLRGEVDAGIYGIAGSVTSGWTANVAGDVDWRVRRAVMTAGQRALLDEAGRRGGDGLTTASPIVLWPKATAGPPEGLFDDVPRGVLSGWLALVPLSVLFYALLPLAASDRATGLYETLLTMPLSPRRAVVARVVAVMVISLTATGLYTGGGLTLVGMLRASMLPGPIDVLRVASAQAAMISALVWAGEGAQTSASAMRMGGLILYGAMGLVGAATAIQGSWVPLGGPLVANVAKDGYGPFALGLLSTSALTAVFLAMAARERGKPP